MGADDRVTGLAARLPRPTEPPLPTLPGRRELVDGARLLVRRSEGARKGTVRAVYVHGLAGSSRNWTDLMHLLGPTLPGVALDLPGFGGSDAPRNGDYGLGAHTRVVQRLVESWGDGPVHLFGNSLGGAVSVRLAAERPDLVQTLTLISPALPVYRMKVSNLHMPLMLMPGMPGVMFRLPPAASVEARADLFIGLCWAEQSRLHPQRRAELVEEVRVREGLTHTDAAYVNSLRGLAAGFLPRSGANLWRAAARVSAPTLVVLGGKDKLIDVSVAGRIARTFPDVRMLVLSELGHVAQLEAPLVVAKAFLDRLDEIADRSQRPGLSDAQAAGG